MLSMFKVLFADPHMSIHIYSAIVLIFTLFSFRCSHSYRSSDEESSNSSHDVSDHCEDDFEIQLRRPKYLQCPAIFTISNLKKFLLHKFSINPNKFCVEIMYKVKTINLPDYYTLMDVAYIYTWKRVCSK